MNGKDDRKVKSLPQVLLLLPAGFEQLEAAAFCDVFRWNMLTGDKLTRPVCAGKTLDIPTGFGRTCRPSGVAAGNKVTVTGETAGEGLKRRSRPLSGLRPGAAGVTDSAQPSN